MVDIIQEDEREYLEIEAKDTCGGFDPEFLGLLPINIDRYISYLNKKDEVQLGHPLQEVGSRLTSGMGFLIMLKYVHSTVGGRLAFANTGTDNATGEGAVVKVRLGLRPT